MLFSAHIPAYALVGLAVSARVFAAPARGGSADLYGRDGLSPIARDAAPASESAIDNTREELFLRALSHGHAGRDVPTTTTVVVLPSLSQATPTSTTIVIVPTASELSSSTVFPITPDLAASNPSDDACGSASAGSDAAAILQNLSLGLNTFPSQTLQKRQNSSCTSTSTSTTSTGYFFA